MQANSGWYWDLGCILSCSLQTGKTGRTHGWRKSHQSFLQCLFLFAVLVVGDVSPQVLLSGVGKCALYPTLLLAM